MIQTVGLLIILGGCVFWAMTGRESALLIGAGMSMVLLGGVDMLAKQFKGMLTEMQAQQRGDADPPTTERLDP